MLVAIVPQSSFALAFVVSHKHHANILQAWYRTDMFVQMKMEVPKGGLTPLWGRTKPTEHVPRRKGYSNNSSVRAKAIIVLDLERACPL